MITKEQMKDKIEEQRVTIEALRQTVAYVSGERDTAVERCGVLETALMPFAQAGSGFRDGFDGNELKYIETDDLYYALYIGDSDEPLQIGHLRAAAALLNLEPQS